MRYLHYEIKAGPEDIVYVTMNEKTDFSMAKVRLLDTGNYFKYRLGKSSETKQAAAGAPRVSLVPPYQGIWHVIVELSGPGEIRAVVDVRKKGRPAP